LITIPLSTARSLALSAQGLDGCPSPPPGMEATAQVIERLGYVQIDTISVVERAHHHVLWTRQPSYQQATLDRLLAVERRIFEYWTHAASYIPIQDYRFYLARMRRYAASPDTQSWLEQNREVVDQVLGRLRDEGPLGAAQFEAPADFRRGTWWSWKPAKQALEMLFNMGEVMVSARRGFQRVYDLAERVLPTNVESREPDQAELNRFLVRRALGGLGVMPESQVMWGRSRPSRETMESLVDAGEVARLTIDGLDGEPYCALSASLERAISAPSAGARRLHILSPFDNLIIQRRWLKPLFSFDYTMEAYVPPEKRQYGYFVLPLLWGDSFVGRLDCKAERKSKTLIIKRLMLEGGTDETLRIALVSRLRAFAAFNGCDHFAVEMVEPDGVRPLLVRELEQQSNA